MEEEEAVATIQAEEEEEEEETVNHLLALACLAPVVLHRMDLEEGHQPLPAQILSILPPGIVTPTICGPCIST